MDATRIIAIRHGETRWNVDTRIQGQTDVELNAKGLWQARCVGTALADEPITRIYSSDLSRAWQTAQAIAGAHATALPDIVPCPGLRERAFGMFEGKTWADIETQWPEASRRWRQRDPTFAPEGGETPVQLRERVAHTLQELAQPHMGEQIVLVAHGGVLDVLYRLATQQDISAPRTWELNNAAINRLLWTPETLTLVGWADIQHLDNALEEFGC